MEHFPSGKKVINPAVVKQWENSFAMNMVEAHLPALRSLSAIKIDWGRNDEYSHIRENVPLFSKKLKANGVNHIAEDYEADHMNRLGGADGRIYLEMLPFFDKYLKFNIKTQAGNQ